VLVEVADVGAAVPFAVGVDDEQPASATTATATNAVPLTLFMMSPLP